MTYMTDANGNVQKVQEDTVPYWQTLGWSVDSNRDGIPDLAGSELPDLAVAGPGQLTVFKNNQCSVAGTYSAPPLGAAVVPPRRWAITNRSTGNITLNTINENGVAISITVLPGEASAFRQVGTTGWVNEPSNKPLMQLDQRYAYARVTALLRRAGSIMETLSRVGNTLASAGVLTSGRMHFTAIALLKGQVITSATFLATTSVVTPTNQWFALYDSNFNLLKVTADDGANAWNAGNEKTLAFAGGAYTVPSDGVYYLGIMVAAATTPQLMCATVGSATTFLPYISAAPTQAGLTNPASAPSVATYSGSSYAAYGWVA